MTRQNNRDSRQGKKPENTRTDAASSTGRHQRNEREPRSGQDGRGDISRISGLDRFRLNDLYERSSI
ncbi:MAG TPA: hypothetical protein VFR58_18385 [Flavisolibacter sp.]|nr:hypothetical protein [Flavisolibacter sp.]